MNDSAIEKQSYNLIIFDFEVFKYDVLLGMRILSADGTQQKLQIWDEDQIRAFYASHKDNSIFIGWNNQSYDNAILEAIVNHQSAYDMSRRIIGGERHMWVKIKLYFYDLITNHATSLKAVECVAGHGICTTDVDFLLDRPLTQEEKTLTETYNMHDVDQTYENFCNTKDEFQLRMDVISEFGLSMDALHVTGTQLAELVLGAKQTPGIETWVRHASIYPTLQVKNKQVLDFFLNEDFKNGKKLSIMLCGAMHQLGSGGIHAAQLKYHCKKALYCDVSGYYNLVMINYDLLPRSIPQSGKEKYKFMYEEQLRLKKTNPNKRWVYKIILLSVFGSMTNEHCKFYDPWNGQLVTMTGQMFIVDLLEKLEGKAKVIQSNTDGIIIEPINGHTEEELSSIVKEWEDRTGFVIKLEHIYDITQRDVNCYMYRTEKGEIHMLGDLKYYEAWDNPLFENAYNAREPIVTTYMVIDYFMNNKLPEQVLNEHKNQLRMFQYVCKKQSFDYLEYQKNFNDGTVQKETLKNVNRAFALKSNDYTGMIYKCKESGKTTRAKVAGLPESVFVYDYDILSKEAYEKIEPMIDWNWYVNRGYERIREFVDLIQIKDIRK